MCSRIRPIGHRKPLFRALTLDLVWEDEITTDVKEPIDYLSLLCKIKKMTRCQFPYGKHLFKQISSPILMKIYSEIYYAAKEILANTEWLSQLTCYCIYKNQTVLYVYVPGSTSVILDSPDLRIGGALVDVYPDDSMRGQTTNYRKQIAKHRSRIYDQRHSTLMLNRKTLIIIKGSQISAFHLKFHGIRWTAEAKT